MLQEPAKSLFVCTLAALSMFVPGTLAQTSPVAAIAFDTKGISSLTYGGQEYLSSGTVKINQIILADASGQQSAGATTSQLQVNSVEKSVGQLYPWGAITVQYAVAGNRLNIT